MKQKPTQNCIPTCAGGASRPRMRGVGFRWLAGLMLAATLVACPPTPTSDTDPDKASMTFAQKDNQAINTDVDSNEITPTGYNAAATVTVLGGKYSINGGAFTNAAGTISPGQNIKLQGRSATTENATSSVLLRIGATESIFTIKTGSVTPSNGDFTPVTNADVSTVYESNQATLAGLTLPAPISVIGGEYQIGDGAFTTSAGTVNNNDVVRVRGTSSATLGTLSKVQLRVGSKTLAFEITTKSNSDASNFTAQTGLNWNQLTESNEITLSNINPATPITITNGEYRITSGAAVGTYTSVPGTVNAGDRVRVRGTTASNDNTAVNVILTLGSGPGAQTRTFTITTGKRIPDPFTLPDAAHLDPNTAAEASVTLSSINLPTPISVIGGQYSINNGAFTSAAGTANPNDIITVRGIAPSTADGAGTNVVLTVGRDGLNPSGGQSDTFTVSSKDWNPSESFTAASNVPPNYSPHNELSWTGLARFPCTGASGDWRYICPEPPPNISVTFNPYVGTLNEASSYIFSNIVTFGANSISPNTPFVIAGGEYRKNGGAWFSAENPSANPTDRLVSPGDTLQVRNNVFVPGSSATATVTFGGVIGTTAYTFPKTFNITTQSIARTDVWTQNAVQTPVTIPDSGAFGFPGPTLTRSITIPATTAKVSRVRVLVTFAGSSINRPDYVIRLIPPAASGKPALTLMDFVNSKPAALGLPAGVNPLDPRLTGSAPDPILVPLLTGNQYQRPWPWFNPFDLSLTSPVPFRLTDGGWGGGLNTIFDSSKFGTDAKILPDTCAPVGGPNTRCAVAGETQNNKREAIGLGQDTYLDGGYSQNSVYHRCGSALYLEARARYEAADLQTGLTQAQIDTLNTNLNRDLPRRLTDGNGESDNDLPGGPTGRIDPYSGKPDRRNKLGEYLDGNCSRRQDQTFYPPVAPDPRIGDLTTLNGIVPTGTWTLEIKDFAPGPPAAVVTLTAFKLIFDFTP